MVYKANKKDKKYLEKTLKTWKNHGKIMEFCWSAAVGTLPGPDDRKGKIASLINNELYTYVDHRFGA